MIEVGSTWTKRTDSPQLVEDVITVTTFTAARLDRSMIYVQYQDGHGGFGTYSGKVAGWKRSFCPTDAL